MIDRDLPDIHEIEGIWNLQRIPDRRGMFPDREDLGPERDFIRDAEESVIADWLLGRKFSEIDNDGSMDALMPLYYLSASASVYYVGGYLLELMRHLTASDIRICGLPIIHLCFYLASSKSLVDFVEFSEDQRLIVVRLMRGILSLWRDVDLGMDPELAEKIGDNLQEIVVGNYGEL